MWKSFPWWICGWAGWGGRILSFSLFCFRSFLFSQHNIFVMVVIGSTQTAHTYHIHMFDKFMINTYFILLFALSKNVSETEYAVVFFFSETTICAWCVVPFVCFRGCCRRTIEYNCLLCRLSNHHFYSACVVAFEYSMVFWHVFMVLYSLSVYCSDSDAYNNVPESKPQFRNMFFAKWTCSTQCTRRQIVVWCDKRFYEVCQCLWCTITTDNTSIDTHTLLVSVSLWVGYCIQNTYTTHLHSAQCSLCSITYSLCFHRLAVQHHKCIELKWLRRQSQTNKKTQNSHNSYRI